MRPPALLAVIAAGALALAGCADKRITLKYEPPTTLASISQPQSLTVHPFYNPDMQAAIHTRTRKKFEVVDITPQVAGMIERAGVQEGICTVFVRHATAAVIINENADAGFRLDIVAALDKLFPEGVWEHDKVDDNGAAHLKAAFLGPSESIPVRDGRLLLGTWQGIALVECDGPRDREVVVDVRS